MLDTLCIVQARMGSKRFPGKMLEKLGEYPIIEWVLTRLSLAKCLSDIVVVIPEVESDIPLLKKVSALGFKAVLGNEEDVLSRFAKASKIYPAKNIVRICADNPLVAPEEIDRLVKFFGSNQYDYAFNHIPKLDNHYPDGFGGEILTARLLGDLDKAVKSINEREHVTQHIWNNQSCYKIGLIQAPPCLASEKIKLDVDTQEDLMKLQEKIAGKSIQISARDIAKIYKQERKRKAHC